MAITKITGSSIADGAITNVNINASAGITAGKITGVTFPFYIAAGTADNITLTGTGALPFYKADGTEDNIGAV